MTIELWGDLGTPLCHLPRRHLKGFLLISFQFNYQNAFYCVKEQMLSVQCCHRAEVYVH